MILIINNVVYNEKKITHNSSVEVTRNVGLEKRSNTRQIHVKNPNVKTQHPAPTDHVQREIKGGTTLTTGLLPLPRPQVFLQDCYDTCTYGNGKIARFSFFFLKTTSVSSI